MKRYPLTGEPATPELIDRTTGNGLIIDMDPIDIENCNASFREHGLDPYKINEADSQGDNRP